MGASSAAAFTGDFDGNGKTITGLYMDGEDAISGLFGYVGKTGSIHDLTIADASVKSMKTGSYNPKRLYGAAPPHRMPVRSAMSR